MLVPKFRFDVMNRYYSSNRIAGLAFDEIADQVPRVEDIQPPSTQDAIAIYESHIFQF